MLQTLEAFSKGNEKEVQKILDNSKQIVMKDESVYFILN